VRLLLLFLIAANLGIYAVNTGALGSGVPDGHDPQRLADQIDPDKIRMVALSQKEGSAASVASVAEVTTPPAPKPMACVEFGGFNAEEARRAEAALAPLNLGGRITERHLDDQATYIVYLPPFKTKADADRAAGELRRIGVQDFFVIQDPGPYHLAISLGIFHSEEAAKGLLTSLSQQGVKNATTGERPSTISKTFYQIRPADSQLLTRLAEIRAGFLNQDLHECAVSGAADNVTALDTASSRDKVATSSSGT
jgi:hypothetical protein